MAISENKKKDMIGIIKLSSKYDVSDINNAKTIKKMVQSEDICSSDIGLKYIDRLDDIIGGSDPRKFKCIFCNSNPASDGILCNECVTKITNGAYSIMGNVNAKTRENADSSSDDNDTDKSGNKPADKSRKKTSGNSGKNIKKILAISGIAIAALCIILLLIFGIRTLVNRSQSEKGDFAAEEVSEDQLASAYKAHLINYLYEVGMLGEVEADVIFDTTVENIDDGYVNRYLININGESVGGLYFRIQNERVDSLVILSPLGAEATSMIMIPAVKMVNPRLSSDEAANIIIETVKQSGITEDGNSAGNIYGDYAYAYGYVDNIYMLRIQSIKGNM